MSWNDVALLVAGVLVLLASVVVVIARRRREIAAEFETALLLHRMASTVDEINGEMVRRRSIADAGGGEDRVELRVIDYHDSPRAAMDDLFQRTLRHHLNHSRNAPHNVIDLWDHITREADEENSYRALIGPAFDDAIYHAAKVGVVDRDQADALVFWASTTAAVERTSRLKSYARPHSQSGSAQYQIL